MIAGTSDDFGAVRAISGRTLRAAGAVALVLGLSACVDGGDFPMFKSEATDSGDEVATRRATRLIERDIEAPEVFQVTEAGLWDGRPSLGGVWVAHPDVKEPERVLIRNTANDKFVIGALFRRERENPGPRVQVSSDAAAALGMLAGAPQNLNVTALRREEAPKPAEAAAENVGSAAPAADPAAQGAEGGAMALAAAPEPAPEKKGFFARLFGGRETPAPEAPVLAAAAPVETATLAAPEVNTVPLASPAAPAAQVRPQPASVPAAPAPKPAASSLTRPYLQIGIFSVEENARNTATAMSQQGMVPTVRKQSSKGKTFWRVLIGPATTESERDALLDKVKATGFTDAYAVTN